MQRLPPNLLQHVLHSAVIGKTGSGKTYAAKGLVEGLLEAGQRVCIIDPTDVWWGLKASADGKREGYPIAVFGGDHAQHLMTWRVGGREILRPKSISFAAMDQTAFESFYDGAVAMILERLLPNTDRADLETRVHEILGGPSEHGEAA